MALPQNDPEDTLRQIEEARHKASEGNYLDALGLASDVLNREFNNALALFLVGYCALKTERFGLAYNVFLRVTQLQPERSEPWNNAGMCHQETWNLDDAERCFRKALQIEPDNAAALQNLALIYVNRCQPEEALRWVKLAEKKETVSWECLDNKALALLMKRDWREGWLLYSKTAGRQKQREIRQYNNEPMWQGEPGTVCAYGTQGIGDEIAFSSCLPDIKNPLIVDCDKRLEGLFRRSFPDVKVYGTRFSERKWEDHVDYSIPFDCLPHLYRNSDEEFPGTPYLKADRERRHQWRSLFDLYEKPVIGIAWTGGLNNTGKKKRSLTLEDFLPILRSVDAVWVSLEYRDRDDQIQAFQKKHGVEIKNWKRATQTDDYDDTAGLVAELDLVISVTTAVVHLCGALGIECWCLAPNKPRWFYGLEGDLPWYKSVKMYRQSLKGEWPLETITNILKLRNESGCLSRR